MTKVVTYRLAYIAEEVELCDACVERGDHNCGSLGPVGRGKHAGECDGAKHGRRARAAAKVAP